MAASNSIMPETPIHTILSETETDVRLALAKNPHVNHKNLYMEKGLLRVNKYFATLPTLTMEEASNYDGPSATGGPINVDEWFSNEVTYDTMTPMCFPFVGKILKKYGTIVVTSDGGIKIVPIGTDTNTYIVSLVAPITHIKYKVEIPEKSDFSALWDPEVTGRPIPHEIFNSHGMCVFLRLDDRVYVDM
jgi:hypothetical protein